MIIAWAGQASLAIALAAAALQAAGFRARPWAGKLAGAQVLFVGLAFALLIYAHVTDEFSLLSVVMHSHTQKPLLYKIAGVWGNHEGSMLLWVFILTLYNACLVRQLCRQEPAWHLVFPLMGLVTFSFLLFLVMACDPFVTASPVPLQGQDLNPLLQDPGLAIHPPCLYTGTTGFAIPFVFAALVLIRGKMPESWASLLYPWVLLGWTFLTLGLGLGSYWAYYELGWGGWWFWDPVENAALMPWLGATALVHALRVFMVTGALRAWTLFLCIFTFSLCLLGAFLVRSGLLTSVHSFAVDAQRGLFLLVISCFLILPVAGLFLARFTLLQSAQTTIPAGRSGLILIMTLFLMCGTLTVATGTLYPLLAEAFGLKITVGGPYFRATFIPMMLPLLFLMGVGAWASWNGNIPPAFRHQLFFLLWITLGGGVAVYLNLETSHLLALGALTGALWTILTTLVYALKNKEYFSGMVYSHVGIGIAVLGIAGSSMGEREIIKTVRMGETFKVGPHALTLKGVTFHEGPNYKAQRASFTLDQGKAILAPEKRFYWTQEIIHGESAIVSRGLHHIYITLGDEYEGQRWSVHAYYKPFLNLLGIGALLVMAGGAIAFFKRRPHAPLKTAACVFWLAWLACAALPCLEAPEQLPDPALEKRARALSQQVLCPQCQGQLLDESPVQGARDLRAHIRQWLTEGQTDQQILNKIIADHGAHVITRPPLNTSTFLLWLAPWVMFIAAAAIVIRRIIKSG